MKYAIERADVVSFWTETAPRLYVATGYQSNFVSNALSAVHLHLHAASGSFGGKVRHRVDTLRRNYDDEVDFVSRMFAHIRTGKPFDGVDFDSLLRLYAIRPTLLASVTVEPTRSRTERHFRSEVAMYDAATRARWLEQLAAQGFDGEVDL